MTAQTMKLPDQKSGASENARSRRRSGQHDLRRNFDVQFAHHVVTTMSQLCVFEPRTAELSDSNCNSDVLSRMTATGFHDICARPKAMSGIRACKHGK